MKIVIMAGGKGTRFWPRSVEGKPKQFLALTSSETMIQQTYRRFLQWLPESAIYVAAPAVYLPTIREQLPDLRPEMLIIEPEQRDTGPCVALTALFFLHKDDDEVIVTTPSDQYIPYGEALRQALVEAETAAQKEYSIVTLGVVPTRPETGYGYIEAETDFTRNKVYKVRAFIEKPNEQKALEFIRQSNMYWNSGIFVWRPSTIEHYMKLHQPQMWNVLSGHVDLPERVYRQLPKISVDYAILEKADQIYTIPVQFHWDDVGAWTSLERIFQPDGEGNIVMGNIHHVLTESSILYTDHQKAVVIGVKDLIVVSTKEGLLVCHKSKEQLIKSVLNSMETKEDQP